MINISAFCILLLLPFVSFAQGKDPIVAKIGKKNITLSEFKTHYKTTESAYNRPSPELFLEDLVRYEVGVLEAEKRNYRNDPIIKERIRQEIYKLLLEKEIGKKVQRIKVSEKEMQAEYKKSTELRTSHILIEFKHNATKKEKMIAKKRALEILKEVKTSKEPFEKLVKLYSDDTLSKAAGGDIGYQSRVTAVPTYYNAAHKLKVNQIYPNLVETRFGYHVLKLTGKRSYKQADKRQLRQVVFESKRKILFDQFFARLKKNYPITINKNTLTGVKF